MGCNEERGIEMEKYRPYKNMTIEQLEFRWLKAIRKQQWDSQDDCEQEYGLRLGIDEFAANKLLFAKKAEIIRKKEANKRK